MRIDKFLALQGVTRGEAKAWLRAGRVQVDGKPARDGGMIIRPEEACVTLDGAQLIYREALHIMLNKPAGVLTAAEDPRRQTVLDLLPAYAAAMRCMPVGRLDLDTEGLLLLTTDGQLAHSLLAPKRHVDKVYEAQLDAPLDPADVEAFAVGIPLKDFTALPAQLEVMPNPTWGRVTVQEGKFHQVKRMFQARGKTVTYLRRVTFGGIALDAALAPGQFRELTAEEMETLRQAVGG